MAHAETHLEGEAARAALLGYAHPWSPAVQGLCQY